MSRSPKLICRTDLACRYDQGQLASAATDFALLCDPEQKGQDEETRAVLQRDQKICFDLAADIIEYTLRDLLSPEGAFYSAEDADSARRETEKKSEGAFYIWSKEEFDAVVGSENAEVVGWFFGVKLDGNVEPKHDMHGEMTGMVGCCTQGWLLSLMATEHPEYGEDIRVDRSEVRTGPERRRGQGRRCLRQAEEEAGRRSP